MNGECWTVYDGENLENLSLCSVFGDDAFAVNPVNENDFWDNNNGNNQFNQQ